MLKSKIKTVDFKSVLLFLVTTIVFEKTKVGAITYHTSLVYLCRIESVSSCVCISRFGLFVIYLIIVNKI